MSDFCDECGVSTDLHDGPDSCESAEMKADTLETFARIFSGTVRGAR